MNREPGWRGPLTPEERDELARRRRVDETPEEHEQRLRKHNLQLGVDVLMEVLKLRRARGAP